MKIVRILLLVLSCATLCNEVARAGDLNRIIYSRIGPRRIGLFIARGDGCNERPLLPADSLDYNPSFSSDGKWVVFTSERGGSADIYRVHPNGSGLERLTDSPAFDDQATLSPDGKILAFVSTRDGGVANIWVLNLGSHQYQQLTSKAKGNFRPSWSPDGKWIAFSSDRDTPSARWDSGWELIQSTAIYMVHPDGTRLKRITELGGLAGSPEWSADSESIIFYESSPKDVYPGRYAYVIGVPDRRAGNAVSQIVSVDLQTGTRKQVTTGDGLKLWPHYITGEDVAYVLQTRKDRQLVGLPEHGCSLTNLKQPSWSADGKTMVYQRNIPTKPPLLAPTFSPDPEFEMFRTTGVFPAYSPSGMQIVMAVFAPNETGRISDSSGAGIMAQLAIMNLDGSESRAIYEAPGKMAVFPAWSPDGKWIAFGLGDYFQVGMGTFERGKPKPSQIAIIQPDGSNFRLLTNDMGSNSGFPSWSPDGNRLVYRTEGASGRGLRILSLADRKITTLTTQYDNFPGWSPHGDLIAFTRFSEGRFSIWTIRPDGTELHQLTNTDGNDAHSVWSPDSKWILFSSSRRGWKDEALLNGTTEADPAGAGPQPYGELFAMHEDGTGVRQLTDNQWEDATPAWMPSSALKSSWKGASSSIKGTR